MRELFTFSTIVISQKSHFFLCFFPLTRGEELEAWFQSLKQFSSIYSRSHINARCVETRTWLLNSLVWKEKNVLEFATWKISGFTIVIKTYLECGIRVLFTIYKIIIHRKSFHCIPPTSYHLWNSWKRKYSLYYRDLF